LCLEFQVAEVVRFNKPLRSNPSGAFLFSGEKMIPKSQEERRKILNSILKEIAKLKPGDRVVIGRMVNEMARNMKKDQK